MSRIKKLSIIGILAFAAISPFVYLYRDQLIELVRQKDLMEYPDAKRCSECHRSIYDSWKESRHSVAWSSKTYIQETQNRSKEKCLPCHIPKEVKAGVKPTPRLKNRDDGVYCVPCHAVDNAMNGPYDLFSPPHPTRQNLEYGKSKICGSCHVKTYKEWKASGSLKTCQGCHMPRSKKRLVQKFPLGLFHSKKPVGDHSFVHGKIKAQDLLFYAELKENKVVVTLLNRSIPHLLPTAENGDPRLFLYVKYFNSSDEKTDQYKEILAPQLDTALPPGEKIIFQYPWTNKTKRVEASLQYKPAWSKEKKEVLHFQLNGSKNP